MQSTRVLHTVQASGATAAGRADLKGSAGMPPLRQAAIPLAAMQRHVSS